MSDFATQEAATPARRSLRGDVLLMLPTRILLLVLGIVTSALIARSLGPSGRGAVAAAFGLALVLLQLGTFGVTAANPYFVAREPETRARLVANSIVLAVALGGVLVGAGFLVRAVAPAALDGVGRAELVVALAAVPATLLAQFLQSIFLGEGRTVIYNAVELAAAVLTLVAVIVVASATDLTVIGALIILAGGRGVAALAFVLASWRGPARLKPDPELARRMIGYGFRVYAATLLAFLVIRIDLLLVNAYKGPTEAGYYAVTVALADALYILPSVVAVNLFAHVARGSDDEQSAKVFRSVAVLYLAVCAVSAALAGPVIDLIYGSEFDDAVPLFYWLAPGIFCLGMLNILAQHFAGRGFPLEAVLVWVVGLALNVAINLAFLPDGGTEVAAISSSAAYILLLALHVRMFASSVGGYRTLRPRWSETVELVRATAGRIRTRAAS